MTCEATEGFGLGTSAFKAWFLIGAAGIGLGQLSTVGPVLSKIIGGSVVIATSTVRHSRQYGVVDSRVLRIAQ